MTPLSPELSAMIGLSTADTVPRTTTRFPSLSTSEGEGRRRERRSEMRGEGAAAMRRREAEVEKYLAKEPTAQMASATPMAAPSHAAATLARAAAVVR